MYTETITLTSHVIPDEKTDAILDKFDYPFTGETTVSINIPEFPKDFQIGIIVGSSGSGKTTILRKCFGEDPVVRWSDDKAVISHFDTAEHGVDLLSAVGLSSIPTWCKPYNALSNGERFRADVSRRLHSGAAIDEFTSVVNREAAKSCSFSIQKYIRKRNLTRIVFASCHKDIIEYLQPDWIYDTDTSQFYNGRYLCRPAIELILRTAAVDEWSVYKAHHYLSGSINRASICYVAELDGLPVCFVAVLAFPFKGCRNAYRESRLVVLPDFQGIGIGNAVSESVAEIYLAKGCRYFSKTTNPRCGEHRDNSPLWKGTSHNHKRRPDYVKNGTVRAKSKYTMSEEMQKIHATRLCYSHEYIGGN